MKLGNDEKSDAWGTIKLRIIRCNLRNWHMHCNMYHTCVWRLDWHGRQQGDRNASLLTVVVHKKSTETLVEVDEPFSADL